MKNKITVISNMYPTKEHKSYGIFVQNQVEALKSKGLDVKVIAIDNPNKGKLNLIKKYGKWFFAFFAYLLSKGKKASVVHAHYVFPSGLLARWHKKLFNTRFIVTAHGGDIDKMAASNDRIYKLTRSILNDADHIIAVGVELYRTLEKDFLVPSEKMSLINMGVNLDVFKPTDKQEAREKCEIQKNVTPLLFVGNIIEQKGLTELIEAFTDLFKNNSSLELFIIGAERDVQYSEKLRALIKKENMEQNIHFLGMMNQIQVALWMAAAEVFVLPSHIEGFGLVALEAMACGTPVVGTNAGGLKYLLDNGNGVIAELKNSSSLKNKIDLILNDEDLKTELINNGLRLAKENDQDIMTNRVINLYNLS